MNNFDTLRAAIAAGPTAGPWVACGPSFGDPLPRWLDCVVQPDHEDGGAIIALADTGIQDAGIADMAYIAAADPQTIAALLAALDEARRDAERLRGALEVSQAATAAAISKSQFQASTNAELNQQALTIRRLKADLCGLLNGSDAAMKGKP